MSAIHRLSSLALTALLLWSAPALAEQRLRLSSGMHEPWTDSTGTGFTNLFVAELFSRLGLTAEVTFNPAAARALQLADDGTDDGLAARIAGLEADYPNLIRVPEPIYVNDFVAVSAGPTAPVRGWGDLSGRSVAYILGWQVFDNNVPPVRELTHAKDSKQLMGMLKSGRAEIILHERWQAEWQARLQGVTLTVHEPPLASTPMYIYLHRRHADLVPRVAAELAAMKAEGRAKVLMAKVMNRAGHTP
ncbi:MAG: substrate-binding periplasmic protein [Bacteroidota bacterium]